MGLLRRREKRKDRQEDRADKALSLKEMQMYYDIANNGNEMRDMVALAGLASQQHRDSMAASELDQRLRFGEDTHGLNLQGLQLGLDTGAINNKLAQSQNRMDAAAAIRLQQLHQGAMTAQGLTNESVQQQIDAQKIALQYAGANASLDNLTKQFTYDNLSTNQDFINAARLGQARNHGVGFQPPAIGGLGLVEYLQPLAQ